MEVGDRIKLEELNESLTKWSNTYSDKRKLSAVSEYNLNLVIASRIDEIQKFKKNFSFTTACMYLLRHSDEEDKETFRAWYADYLLCTAGYKGAEKICNALESEINSLKFVNRLIN